jgi:L-threonylcarbamoyladenylate synthase
LPLLIPQFTLNKIKNILLNGGVIAYPTEGVFGLGCDFMNSQAVDRILAIKKRDVSKGLILVTHHIDTLLPFLIELSVQQRAQLDASWPGPNTWVIPHNGSLPDWVTGGRNTVAVRVSDHPIVKSLCRALNQPLVSTSANHSGKAALTSRSQVRYCLGKDVDAIAPGTVQSIGKASTIRDLSTGLTLRAN